MSRIRTIKPEFFTSEDIVGLSPLARLLYIATWCEADKAGRMPWRPKTLKMRYLPADNCDIDALCEELLSSGLVVLYGDGYAHIPQFKRHQHVNPREVESRLPAPDPSDASTTRETSTRAPRVATREHLDVHSENCRENHELHAQVGREGNGKGTGRMEERANDASTDPEPEGKPVENLTQPTNVGSPTPAGALCRKLRSAGIQAVQSMHPMLLALLDVGASEEEFLDAVPKAIGKSDPFAYLLSTVKKRREQAAEEAKSMAQGPIATPRDIAAEMAEANAERAYAASRQWAEDFRKRGEESQSPASHAARIAAMKRFRAVGLKS